MNEENSPTLYAPFSLMEIMEAMMAIGHRLGREGADLGEAEDCLEKLSVIALGNGADDDFCVPPIWLHRTWRAAAAELLPDYDFMHRMDLGDRVVTMKPPGLGSFCRI